MPNFKKWRICLFTSCQAADKGNGFTRNRRGLCQTGQRFIRQGVWRCWNELWHHLTCRASKWDILPSDRSSQGGGGASGWGQGNALPTFEGRVQPSESKMNWDGEIDGFDIQHVNKSEPLLGFEEKNSGSPCGPDRSISQDSSTKQIAHLTWDHVKGFNKEAIYKGIDKM